MPQATIKLQAAPAPAAARKSTPVTASPAPSAKGEEAKPAKASREESLDDGHAEAEEASVDGGLPVPLLIAAAALAVVAFAVQLWTFLS